MRISMGIVTICAFLGFVPARGGEMKELSFYNVKPVGRELTVDGNLDEAEWKTACSHTRYYEYFKPDPEIGKLETEYRMLYSKKGIYLAILNHEKNMDKLKAEFTARDSENLWKDDCDEIYIDAFGEGVGYTKFTINSIGTVGDMKRIDNSVVLNEWSGSGWTCAVVRNGDSWVVEAFFPWDDLGNTAKEGAVWRFCNTRYAWTFGNFVGVSSSPGGSYQNTAGFGYLYFSGEKPLSPDNIGSILSERVAPSWMLSEGNNLIICEKKAKFKVEPVAGYVVKEKEKVLKLTDDTRRILEKLKDAEGKVKIAKTLDETVSALDKANPEKASVSENMLLLKKLSKCWISINESYWLAKTVELLDNKI